MNANGYFRKLDPQIKEMAGFPIPPDWWSRGYEYAWAIAQARPGEMVMDAGCGFGHPLKYELAKVSKRVFAVDVSPGVLELTEREGVEYICADMADTGLPAESMDTIYCISVLEHLKKEELWDVWQEFIRLLKPGGRVVITLDVLFDPGKGPKPPGWKGPPSFWPRCRRSWGSRRRRR